LQAVSLTGRLRRDAAREHGDGRDLTRHQDVARLVRVNPDNPQEKACDWLAAGARDEWHRRIGAYSSRMHRT